MYLSIGLDKDFIDDSTPKELEPYVKAHDLIQKRRDEEMWMQGAYFLRAIQVAVNFSKEKIEYYDKPFLRQYEDEHRELTEEEKLAKQKQIFAMLEIMQANFELNHKGQEKS